MYQVVCTKTCDHADDAKVKVFSYSEKNAAIACFNENVNKLLAKCTGNEFLQMKMSMHQHKALIQIEGTHYLIAIVEDGGLFDKASKED